MTHDRTPVDLTITPRDRRFGRHQPQARWWMGGDPFATAFMNALSVTFPKGEAFFIESVKAHRDGAPPRLAHEIRQFVVQEVLHSREHVAFNRRVVDAGYDISRLEDQVAADLALTENRPPILNLAVTLALEHYTAIMANKILTHPQELVGTDPEQAELWRWHAIEEIEHKGVAYDTWLHATKGWTRGKRWWVKSVMMLLVTSRFWRNRYRGAMDLLAQDGITGWRAHRGLLNYLLGRPGVARRLVPSWATFFLPGFHPWNHDDRHLIAGASGDYAMAPVTA